LNSRFNQSPLQHQWISPHEKKMSKLASTAPFNST
jgi:hypothetical protein